MRADRLVAAGAARHGWFRGGHAVCAGVCPLDAAPLVGDGEFTAFYVDGDGCVTAALTVGRSDDLDHARRFVTEGSKPDRGALADMDMDLGSL